MVEESEYEASMGSATKLIADRDSSDIKYVACALALNADLIWTNDADFKVQDSIPTKNTAELIEFDRCILD